MYRKAGLYAVMGGVVGAVLVMAVGSIAPLGAQNEVRDAEFGNITCRSISMKGDLGVGGVVMQVGENGGEIIVKGKNGGLLGISGSTILIQSGEIRVMDKQFKSAVIKGYEDTVLMGIVGSDDEHRVLIGNTENGGTVLVQGNDGIGRVAMGINSHGDGIVTAEDKNGKLSWSSIGK